MCDGSLRPGEGEPPPAAPPAGRPVEGNERGGGLPWAAPRPAAPDSWGFARAAAAGASGERRLQRGPWVPGIWGDVQLTPIRGCVHTCPGGSDPPTAVLGSDLDPFLRPAAGAGAHGSRVAHASRGHHPRPRIRRPAPPRGVCSAFLPGSQEVPTPHPTVLLLSCPPTPPRPCTRGDAGEAPTAGRHTLSVAVILKPTPARRPPPPRPPDSAGPTGPLFHWELPISARDGSVLTIQRPQSEVLGFHSHAPMAGAAHLARSGSPCILGT